MDLFLIAVLLGEHAAAVFLHVEPQLPCLRLSLPEAGAEFDRIVRDARKRTVRGWALGLSGAAAAVAAVLLLTPRPAAPAPAPASNSLEIIEQLRMISSLDPGEAERYDFKPVGDGFIMTATYPDGSTASFILSPVDGGESYYLVSLNE